MNTATIFYRDEQWMQGADNPFGVRYDASILPSGSVVVGFMIALPQGLSELLDPPALLPNQEQAWKETVCEAHKVLNKRPVWSVGSRVRVRISKRFPNEPGTILRLGKDAAGKGEAWILPDRQGEEIEIEEQWFPLEWVRPIFAQ